MFEGRRAPVETLRRLMALDRANSQRNRAIKELVRKSDDNGFLAEALLEVRELVDSGSEAMHIIDEALGKAGISPFPTRHPDCKGRGTVHTIDEECDHCRKCGGNETDPDGLCEICLMCSLCCGEQPCPHDGEETWADVFYR